MVNRAQQRPKRNFLGHSAGEIDTAAHHLRVSYA